MRFFRKKEDEDILLCDLDESVEIEDTEPEEKPNWKKTLLVYVHDVLYLLALLVVVSLVLRVVVVDGTSMNNTLKDGDYLLVLSNIFYRNPKQGDVVVASKETFDNGAPIVKRVIATEGQKVDIDFEAGIVYVDDQPLDEPYTMTPTSLYEGIDFPLIVGDNCIFVLGDNRNGSRDSRHPSIGLIDEREVIGKVIFLFIPGTNGMDYAGNPKESRDFSRIGLVN
ncbi:MAG: signal peptidase I [Oscillospiraceae bacterium]|nr:signal peptidase I [Oscillospiraceae bacterium]